VGDVGSRGQSRAHFVAPAEYYSRCPDFVAPRRRGINGEKCLGKFVAGAVQKPRVRVVIRIAVSARAYRAIKATLPEGSVVYPPERNDRGQYLLWLDRGGGEPAWRRSADAGSRTAARSFDWRRRLRGGHFPGGSMLPLGQGRGGARRAMRGRHRHGENIDRKSFTFMRSFPNFIPLSAKGAGHRRRTCALSVRSGI
jgi:hypothetical protein